MSIARNNLGERMRLVILFITGGCIAFNSVGFAGNFRNFTIGLLSVSIYFISLLPILSAYNKIRGVQKKCIKLIISYFLLLTTINILYLFYSNSSFFNLSLFSCIVFFIGLLIHAAYNNNVLVIALYGFAFGVIILSFLFVRNIGVEYDDFRLLMFGENSNSLGIYATIGAVVILNDFILYDKLKLRLLRFLFIIPLVNITLLSFATGSRVTFISFVLSAVFIVFLYPMKNRFIKSLFIIVSIMALIYAGSKLLTTDSSMVKRLLLTAEEGNTAGRTDIWKALLPYIWQHPLFGVGQTGYVAISQEALGHVYSDGRGGFSPHNVLLEVTLYTGFVGLMIMLSFWYKIFKIDIKSYLIQKNSTGLISLIPILGCILSGQILTTKIAWLLYAYMLSLEYGNQTKELSKL